MGSLAFREGLLISQLGLVSKLKLDEFENKNSIWIQFNLFLGLIWFKGYDFGIFEA
jgi:hypothetical protein